MEHLLKIPCTSMPFVCEADYSVTLTPMIQDVYKRQDFKYLSGRNYSEDFSAGYRQWSDQSGRRNSTGFVKKSTYSSF